jgi:hypothetical protein
MSREIPNLYKFSDILSTELQTRGVESGKSNEANSNAEGREKKCYG